MLPVAAFIQPWTDESISAEQIATNMKKQLEPDTPDGNVRHATRMFVSTPSRTDSVPSSSSSDKDDNLKSNKRLIGLTYRSCRRHRCLDGTEKKSKACLLRGRSAKLDESSSDSDSYFHTTHKSSQGVPRSKKDRAKVPWSVNIHLLDALKYQNYLSADKS